MKEYKVTYLDLFTGEKYQKVVKAHNPEEAQRALEEEWAEYNACDYIIINSELTN